MRGEMRLMYLSHSVKKVVTALSVFSHHPQCGVMRKNASTVREVEGAFSKIAVLSQEP